MFILMLFLCLFCVFGFLEVCVILCDNMWSFFIMPVESSRLHGVEEGLQTVDVEIFV